MNDSIQISDLKVEALIGVHEFERIAKQPLILNLKLDLDLSKAGKSDNLDDTLDYDRLTQDIILKCNETQFQLIESLAESLAKHILNHYPALKRLTLKIEKPKALSVAKVAVEITRSV